LKLIVLLRGLAGLEPCAIVALSKAWSDAVDLREHPPRRSRERLAGFIWLPRLIDKVRAFQAGTLGAYAYPSLTDRLFMRKFHLTPALLEQTVCATLIDELIAEQLQRASGLSQNTIAASSDAFERKYRLVFAVLDCDDGYTSGIGYPIPRFLQPFLWNWYKAWAAKKASATDL
jgi:hypothetical protein